jgi:hypothetical protein
MDLERQFLLQYKFPRGVVERINEFYRPDRIEHGPVRMRIRKAYCTRTPQTRLSRSHWFGIYHSQSGMAQDRIWGAFDNDHSNRSVSMEFCWMTGYCAIMYEVRYWEYAVGWTIGDYLHYWLNPMRRRLVRKRKHKSRK